MNTPTFEKGLIDALQPFRGFVLAAGLQHLFRSGLYDALAGDRGRTAAELASELKLDAPRVQALLQFMKNEEIVEARDGHYTLAPRGRSFARYRGWYTMLVGGYGTTFLQLGDCLREGAGAATRAADQVGIGSCAISQHGAIPMTRRLMAKIPSPVNTLLDLGCGNALYLVDFLKHFPTLKAWGVEPDRGGYEAAVELVKNARLEERVTLVCSGAVEFLRAKHPVTADLIVLGFVLHEILGQEGEPGVVAFLQELVARYPAIHLVVIEVDNKFDDPEAMKHGLALGYYNAYYLFHPFTRQRLETRAYWESLFDRAGLQLVARDAISPEVDSTGLEIGFLLRRKP